MLSYRLWRALNHPPRHHPLFQYTLTHAKREEPRLTSAFFMWMFLCSSITFCWTALFDWLPLLLVTLLLSLNTVYSLVWSVRISSELQVRRDDLLSALPTGQIGSVYAISTGCLHRRASFRWVPFIVQGITIAGFITTLAAVGMSLIALRNPFSPEMVEANQVILYLSIAGTFLVPLFLLDHLYSTLLAVMVGIIAPIDTLSKAEARIRAGFATVTLQVLTYTIFVATVLLLIAPLLRLLNITGSQAVIWGGGLSTLVYIILREWSVRRLWQYLQHRVNAHTQELEIVFGDATY